MPTLKTMLMYLTAPDRLVERLVEKRMNARALAYYQTQSEAAIDRERLTLLGEGVQPFVHEARASTIYQHIAAARSDTAVQSQTTSLSDCVTMYALVRLHQPRVMVETGVFFGAMSAMILEAMAVNGGGRLYSIDLPVEGDGLPAARRGEMVPENRRADWTLILGDSREHLPVLLSQLGTIDAFNHDSLHTTAHMRWEYETAWQHLKRGGLLTSHDVLTTPAWDRFCEQQRGTVQAEGRVFGLGFAVKAV